jgi:hypothetical protein
MNFYNMGACDLEKEAIICIGSEILDPDPVFEDKIVGWVLVKDGSKVEILVSEEFAKNTDHPLFIITNGVDEYLIEEAIQSSENNAKTSLKGTDSYHGLRIYEEQINYRYEGSGDSEYNVAWIMELWSEISGYNGTSSMSCTRKHIKDIDKDEIGDLLSHDFDFYHYIGGYKNYSFYSGDRYLLSGVTYEHDWYASLKTKLVPTGFGFDAIIKFRASGSSEYYQPFCFDVGYGGAYSWYSFDQTVYSKGLASFESF